MDELIRKQDAIDCCFWGDGRFRNIQYAVEDIRRLQPVQPEVLAHGEGELKESEQWIPYSVEDGTVTIDVSSISDKIRGCRIELYFGKEEEKDGC